MAIRSDLGWSTADRITVLGKDLPGEILGKVDLGDIRIKPQDMMRPPK